MQLSVGGFQVVYSLGLWSRVSGIQSPTWTWLVNYLHFYIFYTEPLLQQHVSPPIHIDLQCASMPLINNSVVFITQAWSRFSRIVAVILGYG